MYWYLVFTAGNYSQICVIRADLEALAVRTTNSNRQTYYTARFDIVLSFGLTELKAQIVWRDKKVRYLSINSHLVFYWPNLDFGILGGWTEARFRFLGLISHFWLFMPSRGPAKILYESDMDQYWILNVWARTMYLSEDTIFLPMYYPGSLYYSNSRPATILLLVCFTTVRMKNTLRKFHSAFQSLLVKCCFVLSINNAGCSKKHNSHGSLSQQRVVDHRGLFFFLDLSAYVNTIFFHPYCSGPRDLAQL